MGRRQALRLAAGTAAVAALPAAARGQDAAPGYAVTYEDVVAEAAALAEQPHEEHRRAAPAEYRDLTFDDYRRIRFRPEQALWLGEKLFSVQFFHPGFYFERMVDIQMVTAEGSQPVAYDPAMFDSGGLALPPVEPADLGFAGFRLHYPLHSDADQDEFAVFLGASYFRLVGRDQQYGISARGLAIDTAESAGEEFPDFTRFWLLTPEADATQITIMALLESPSVTGAYRFILRPRTNTQADIEATLFPRRTDMKLGLAPLTSMFKYGENSERRFDDFRPEVHDSDGLAIHNGRGEWIWRPLANHRTLQVSAFLDNDPRGFGLLQRDRRFDSYQDLEAAYERRPSKWVLPFGNWQQGHVELVEIPTDTEIHDNIVSYWVPDAPPEPGVPIHARYLLVAFLDNPNWPPGGHAVSTRIGTDMRPGDGTSGTPGGRLFVVDFIGGDLPFLEADQPVRALVEASTGEIAFAHAVRNPAIGGWRAFFDFVPDNDEPAVLRCFLNHRGHALTETWSYLWTP